jgi:hypothetical protein
MFESLVNHFDTMSLGEELYTFCFTAFMFGGAAYCCVRCLKEISQAAAEPLPPEPMAKAKAKPVRPPRRKARARVTQPPPRPRRALAPRPETRVLPYACRRPAPLASWQQGAHAPFS